MTKTIRYALAIESFFNISGATLFLLFPSWCLSHVLYDTASPVPASTATLWQVYSLLVLALTLPLLLCIPESPGVVTKRTLIFQILSAGEASLIALLLWKALDAESSGFSTKGLLLSAANLVPLLAWRGWVLLVRPDWLEMDDGGVERRGKKGD